MDGYVLACGAGLVFLIQISGTILNVICGMPWLRSILAPWFGDPQ